MYPSCVCGATDCPVPCARCMVAVLFLVGEGLEEPSVIDQLLDVETNPR